MQERDSRAIRSFASGATISGERSAGVPPYSPHGGGLSEQSRGLRDGGSIRRIPPARVAVIALACTRCGGHDREIGRRATGRVTRVLDGCYRVRGTGWDIRAAEVMWRCDLANRPRRLGLMQKDPENRCWARAPAAVAGRIRDKALALSVACDSSAVLLKPYSPRDCGTSCRDGEVRDKGDSSIAGAADILETSESPPRCEFRRRRPEACVVRETANTRSGGT